MNTKIDDLCDKIASEICTHIIDQCRALNGENDTWNELLDNDSGDKQKIGSAIDENGPKSD